LGFPFDPAPGQYQMQDDKANKSEREIEMDIAPLMAMEAQKIFLALPDCGAFGEEKAHENAYKSDPKHTDKKQSVYEILPV
jgi:hypothetical protein